MKMRSETCRVQTLLFGPSRSGKTFLTARFRELGAEAYDAQAEGLCSWTNDTSGAPAEYPVQPSKEWLQENHFTIAKEGLSRFLEERRSLIMLGHAWNILDVLEQFDKCFYLYTPPEELERRFGLDRGADGLIRPATIAFHRELHAERLAQVLDLGLPILDTTQPAEVLLEKTVTS